MTHQHVVRRGARDGVARGPEDRGVDAGDPVAVADAGAGHARLRGELLGLGADQPARAAVPRTRARSATLTESDVALLVAVPVLVGSLGRIVVGALTDRYGGRVMFPLVSARHDRAGPVHRVLRPRLLRPAARRRLLPRHRAAPRSPSASRSSTPGSRPERRGLAIGVFGAGMGGTAISALTTVKLFTNVGDAGAVPDHRGRAGGLRRRRRGSCCATPRAGWCRPTSLVQPARRQRPAADHLAGLRPLRRRLRRLRRVLGLPAGLPQDRLRADPGRRRQPDGRLRRGRGDHAPGRRLALRPVRRRSRCWPPAYAVVAVGAGVAAGTPPLDGIGTVAFLAMAAALGSGSGATFALIATGHRPVAGSAGSPAWSAPPAGSAGSCRR